MKANFSVNELDFEKGAGLVSVVVQHARNNAVLMVAFANRDALEKSLETGEMHFYSRTRGPWHKGQSSGHVLRIVELLVDCDKDTVLARVEPFGPTCHTGQTTCFGEPTVDAIRRLEAIVMRRATKPAVPGERESYTKKLLDDRNLRLKKIGEEAGELIVALADNDKERIAEEAADVVYHVVVALQAAGITFDEVRRVLEGRAAGAPALGAVQTKPG